MSASARRSPTVEAAVARDARPNGGSPSGRATLRAGTVTDIGETGEAKLSVFVAAENRLLREALARMLMKKGNIEVAGLESGGPLQTEELARAGAHVLLLTSRGGLNDDLMMIQRVRETAPAIRILLLGMAKNEAEFLQCVRAGISGYLLHDASSEEVVAGVRAVYAGEAVCPGSLCASLFRYFESEASSLVPVSARRSLGLTRREQQLIPLIGKGLTNKEIANHFSLSEQTVKNHLYRMKQKTGAEGRLDLVQLCRVQGFLV